MDSKLIVMPELSDKETYLDRAEACLFQQFCKELLDGQYRQARKVLSMMQALSIV